MAVSEDYVDADRAREFAMEVEKMRSISTSTPVAVKALFSSVVSEADSGLEDTMADSCFNTSTTASYSNYSLATDSDYSFHSRPTSTGLFYSPILKERLFPRQDNKEHSLCDWEIAEEEDVFQKINNRNFTGLPCRSLNFDIDENDSGFSSSPTIELSARFHEVLTSFSPPVLDHLIGRKMGLEHVDIVSELSKKNVICIANILSYLEPQDLCRMCLVNKKWRKTMESNSTASSRKITFLESSHSSLMGKENWERSVSLRSSRGLTDANTFCLIQHTQCQLASTPYSKFNSTDLFTLAANSLREGEMLRHCPKCFGASRVLPGYERGTCFNSKCNFDYCGKCFNDYHGSKTCHPASKKQKKYVVCSKKAKKNLKRLSNL